MRFSTLPLLALAAQQALAIALPSNDQVEAGLEARRQARGGNQFGGGFGGFGGGAPPPPPPGNNAGKGAGGANSASSSAAPKASAPAAGKGGAGKGGAPPPGKGGAASKSSAVVGASTTSVAQTSATPPPADVAKGAGNKGTGKASTTTAAVPPPPPPAAGGTTTSAAATASASLPPPPPSNPGLSAAQVSAAQTSLQLDKSQVQPELAENGLQIADAGEVASATSTNNFINFCMTQDTTLTDGQQTRAGSCNPTIMGMMIPADKLVSSKFINPPNGGKIAANTTFTISMNIVNMNAGQFADATTNYYGAPCTTTNGIVDGHTHYVIEPLQSLGQTTPTNPLTFTFFKGVDTPAVNGVLSVTVPGGIGPGAYRLASINTCTNHQPVLASIAQHGHSDDMSYFTVE